MANQKAAIALWSELLETFAGTLKQLALDGNPEKATATRLAADSRFYNTSEMAEYFLCLDCVSQTSGDKDFSQI